MHVSARAGDLERCYSLFLTDQMQFMLLPGESQVPRCVKRVVCICLGREPLPMKTVYEFDDLVLSVRSDMDANIIRIITYSILERLGDLLECRESFDDARSETRAC